MKKINFLFYLMFLLLLSCRTEDTQVVGNTTFDVNCRAEFQNTVYPSLILNQSGLEQRAGFPLNYFTININSDVKKNIQIDILESTLNYETIIDKNNLTGNISLVPDIKWKYDAIKYFTQPGQFDLTFVCYDADNHKEIDRKTIHLTYRSANECVYATYLNSNINNMTYIFTSYINEDQPIIGQFLKNVQTLYPSVSFTGYLAGNGNPVDLQVNAIYNTLQSQGVKYSNVTGTSNTNQFVSSQYVRFIDEVLTTNQANCMDGVVFFCSVLRKIGIHTLMVMKPGHTYLAYYRDQQATNVRFLETTVIGSGTSFIDATNAGSYEYNTDISHYNPVDVTSGYYLINVDYERQFIKPIGR